MQISILVKNCSEILKIPVDRNTFRKKENLIEGLEYHWHQILPIILSPKFSDISDEKVEGFIDFDLMDFERRHSAMYYHIGVDYKKLELFNC